MSHHTEHCEFVGGRSDPRNADPRISRLFSHQRATLDSRELPARPALWVARVGARQDRHADNAWSDRQRDPQEFGREDPRNSGHGQSHPMLPLARVKYPPQQRPSRKAGAGLELAATVAARGLVKRARSLRSRWPRSSDDSRPSPAGAPANADGRPLSLSHLARKKHESILRVRPRQREGGSRPRVDGVRGELIARTARAFENVGLGAF